MDGVKWVEYISCTECARRFNELDGRRRRLMEERARLPRCQGCYRLRAASPDRRERLRRLRHGPAADG